MLRFTMVSGLIIKGKEKEKMSGLMVEFLMVNGVITKCMDKANL